MPPIQVFVCDDDPLFRELIVDYLSREPDLFVSGAAANKHQLLKAVEEIDIDILLLDINLTGSNYDGLEVAIELQSSEPDLKIIVLSSLDEEVVMTHAITYGRVSNYITKEHYRDIPDSIRGIAAGKGNLHHSSAGKFMRRVSSSYEEELKRKLTSLQKEILRYLQQGKSTAEIAELLFYNEQSVNNELCKITKLIKGKFPYLEWLRLKKHNRQQLLEMTTQLRLLD
ncbi:response regulator transcription factor [Cohnella lupini]|uniref:LuxR family two component transcriptional regulator n=1 Tax=Cohnella lupini TaxID=1294267 RepID=A0A3D9IA12_9BACL|nr:response regulator transcription factor [Cohnella lupini]RED58016.1 LuxR family two component transcriptional regulator [Cohnella lupini]